MYFSDELDGRGYKIGKPNFERFCSIMFDGLGFISSVMEEDKKIYTVVCEKRLTQDELNHRRENCVFKYASGVAVRVYVMAEMA